MQIFRGDGEIVPLLSASELSGLAVLGDTTSQVCLPAATNPPPTTTAVAPYDRVEEGVSNSQLSSLVARSAGDSCGSMFITVRCRNHEDGKPFYLRGDCVDHVPLDAGGRRTFRKQKDESLEEFEMYVQKIVSKQKVPLLLTPARVLIS